MPYLDGDPGGVGVLRDVGEHLADREVRGGLDRRLVTDDMRARVKAITGGKGLDVVYDPVGGPYSELALRDMAWGGRLLVVGRGDG